MSKAKNEKHNSRYYQTLEYLKTKWKPGITAVELAEEAFMTRQAIYPYCKDLGRAGYKVAFTKTIIPETGTREYDAYMDKATRKLKSGMTIAECCEAIRTSEPTFRRKFKPEMKKRGIVFKEKGQVSKRTISERTKKRKTMYELFLAGNDARMAAKLSGYKLATAKYYQTLYSRGRLTKDGRIMGKAECEDVPESKNSDHRVDA